jgi:hypothetical protein
MEPPPTEPAQDAKPSAPQLPRMQVKEAPATSKITNFVGRTVNGFEI